MVNIDIEEIRFVPAFYDEFPERLRNIPNPPKGLYIKGRFPDESRPSVAIVGSRDCSQYGAGMAKYYAEVLSKAGVQIISGLARGVDGIAQKTALDAGHPTFGVLGCGVDVVYPKSNREIFERITEKGALISEFPPGTPAIARQFPSRNRIIAGLADVLLVVEAKVKSGTGITVRNALEQGKDVYAIPGRVTDPLSAGCNKLIADGAGAALTPDDVLLALGIEPSGSRKNAAAQISKLARREKMLYSVLDLYPRTLDELSNMTGLTAAELLGILLQLELKGLAAETGKNNYIRKS
ncbi:MAG: DNA-processing protein DprA [Lachnospiraceae bacterium]|nr:DNA-processing protein DprA [Lachnospiraceae bacterium]